MTPAGRKRVKGEVVAWFIINWGFVCLFHRFLIPSGFIILKREGGGGGAAAAGLVVSSS